MFNQIRLKMRVIYASDIVAIGKRKTILPNILCGENYRDSEINWPKIHEFPMKWLELYAAIYNTSQTGPQPSWSMATQITPDLEALHKL